MTALRNLIDSARRFFPIGILLAGTLTVGLVLGAYWWNASHPRVSQPRSVPEASVAILGQMQAITHELTVLRIAVLSGQNSDLALNTSNNIIDVLTEISVLQLGVDGIRDGIGSIRDDIGGIRLDIGGIQDGIGGIKGEMGYLETLVSGLRR